MPDPATPDSAEPNRAEYADPARYDAENPWGPDDDFYLALARRRGSPVLDLACGTGRLAAGLAAAGLAVTAVDRSAAMLDFGRQRRALPGIDWQRGDVAGLALGRRFPLVVMTGHAFQELLTPAGQAGCLAVVAAHLAEGGCFAFDLRNPAALDFSDPQRVYPVEQHRGADGRHYRLVARSGYDPVTGIDRVTIWRRSAGQPDQPATVCLKYTAVAELDRLLIAAGLVVTDRFGDWPDRPFQPDSPEVITLCALA